MSASVARVGAGVASRDFRLLWAGSGISVLGGQVGSVAMPLVGILLLHVDAFGAGVLAACSAGAAAVLALPAGALVDRVRRRPLMITTDVAQALALTSVPLAVALDALTFGHLAAVALVLSVCTLLGSVAASAHLPALVGREHLLAANSRTEATFWSAALLGPAVGGLLVGAFGAARTLLVDAVSFLVSAAALLLIRQPEVAAPRAERRPIRADVRDGLRFVRGHRPLRRLITANAVLAWAISMLTPAELLLAVRELGATPLQFGVLMAVPCVGGLAGAAIAPRAVARWGLRPVIRLSALLRAPTIGVIALVPAGTAGLVVMGVAFTGLLLAAGVYNSVQNAYQQQVTPDRLRGRVTAASKWIIGLGRPVAPLLGGLLATRLPLRAVFAVCAVLLLVPVLLVGARGATGADPGEERPSDR